MPATATANNGNGNEQGQGNQGQGNQGQGNQGPGNAGNLRRNVRPIADLHHISPDLNRAIHAPAVTNLRWARDGSHGRLVQVVITADNSGDRMLTALRHAIVLSGGSVHRRYDNLGTLYALLPASMVQLIAARSDVINIAPNRPVIGTSSFLEQTTGTADVRNSVGGAPALDGSGIGIAVLDSGIMDTHAAFSGANGKSRVLARTDLTGLTPDWTQGVDTSGNPLQRERAHQPRPVRPRHLRRLRRRRRERRQQRRGLDRHRAGRLARRRARARRQRPGRPRHHPRGDQLGPGARQ